MTYDNPHRFDDPTTETAFNAGIARLNASIKAAVSKGVRPGIESAPAQLIAPPPSSDPFHGRRCLGPGLQKNGFGRPKICGRQAIAVLRTFRPEAPDKRSAEDKAAELNAQFARQVYGGSNDRIYAGSGQRVGSLLPNPNDPPSGDERWVCFFHGPAGHHDVLHPEDGGKVPEAPKHEVPLMGLEHLDSSRQFRTVQSDPNFCAVTDGVTTVLVHTRDYIAFLRENGSLPPVGQPL